MPRIIKCLLLSVGPSETIRVPYAIKVEDTAEIFKFQVNRDRTDDSETERCLFYCDQTQ